MENNEKHLCDYGCGKEGKYQLKNGKLCCSKSQNSCPTLIKNNPRNKGKKKVKILREKPELCDYGCGQEAIHQLKNGKWCCNNSSNSCFARRNKIKKPKPKTKIFKNEEHKLCCYGCGQEAKYQFKNGNICCSENPISCKVIKDKSGILLRKTFLNKKHNIESNEKNRQSNIKWWNEHLELKIIRKIELKEKSLYYNKRRVELGRTNKGICFLSEKNIEDQRQRMLNGGAAKANSGISNPSKPQVELFNRVKELYPNAILNYPILKLNYSLDVAIPDLKIWFESDGSYWHQDKEKDMERQRKIEDLGWKCIRYVADNIGQVPTVQKIKKDIEEIYENII